ncbi:MAG: bifunctional serine/threonine-protein kinase/formylglycine-generating enzyme family protein, partial [Chloroflexales bacterium]
FANECAILQALAHDNLPRYYEWFEANGNGYLVMELVAGDNLDEILRREGGRPLPQSQVMGYAVQLCDVLSYLHTQPQPILHRDIKPANIRFTPAGLLKLVDFGLLKQGTQGTHTALRGMGTEEYTPFEQYGRKGQHTDQRSDLYSLGATLYHLLTGQTPPVVTTRMTTSTDPLLPADELNSALAPHIAAALHRALRPLQNERYPDVKSFKAALLHADPDSSPSPPPPPPPPDPALLRRLWQQARQAYVLKEWLQAEKLFTEVAALNPQYENVQTLLAEATVQAEYIRCYAHVTELRAVVAWEQGLALLAKLPPDFPDPQQHRPWATAHQRRDQHYEAALLAAQHETWREVLIHLTKLLAETPNDEDATKLQAHAQAKWFEAEMVEVPAGPFLMGSSDHDKAADSDEKPQHSLTLPRYWIGKTPITNAQFRPFVEGDGYTNQAYWTPVGWQWREAEKIVKPDNWDDAKWNGADYPVVGVSWFEAVAYCRWLTKQTGIEFRLPTEAEWEKAARGPDGRIYPWGNTWEAGRCNSGEAGIECTTPVGQYPTGASPYGALDMAGNVLEWTQSVYTAYPYSASDGRENLSDLAGKYFTIRGGSWRSGSLCLRAAYRSLDTPACDDRLVGLRLARHL